MYNFVRDYLILLKDMTLNVNNTQLKCLPQTRQNGKPSFTSPQEYIQWFVSKVVNNFIRDYLSLLKDVTLNMWTSLSQGQVIVWNIMAPVSIQLRSSFHLKLTWDLLSGGTFLFVCVRDGETQCHTKDAFLEGRKSIQWSPPFAIFCRGKKKVKNKIGQKEYEKD